MVNQPITLIHAGIEVCMYLNDQFELILNTTYLLPKSMNSASMYLHVHK